MTVMYWDLMILGVHDSNLNISFKDVLDNPIDIIVRIKLKKLLSTLKENNMKQFLLKLLNSDYVSWQLSVECNEKRM